MYTTIEIVKFYLFLNLLFLLILLLNSANFYILLGELLTLYFGSNTIYCLLEGNCKIQVLLIIILYLGLHIFSLLLLRGYFPNIKKKLNKIKEIIFLS
tara:strand:+ start:391 stop:684 length:294 start_codon:yes stop_codon:yes gene_type:complete